MAEELEQKTLEERMEMLQDIIERLESSELSLDESFRLYKEGMQQLQLCNGMIDTVEKELQIIEEGGAENE